MLSDVVAQSGLSEESFQREGVDGLIGYDFLAAAIIDMNLDQATMRIEDPTKVTPSADAGVSVLVDLTTGQPRVPMKLPGSTDILATLDSGNTFCVLFSGEISRTNVHFFSEPRNLASNVAIGGAGGAYEIAQCGRLDSLQVGPIVYRGLRFRQSVQHCFR